DASWNFVSTADISSADSNYGSRSPAHLADDTSSFDTDMFPSHSHLFPQETNGTWRTETAHNIRHPSTIDWCAVGSLLADAAESTSEKASEALNRACEGHDIVEMGNRVVDMFPKLSMPTTRQLDQTVDWASDTVEGLRQRWSRSRSFNSPQSRSAPPLRVGEMTDVKQSVVCQMNRRACSALITQGICGSSQLSIIYPVSSWQTRLSAALSSFFSTQVPIYSAETVSSMRTVWVADIERTRWVLALDTGLVEVDVNGDGHLMREKAVLLEVGFELEKFPITGPDAEEWLDVE
ncbi:hypothetical protein T440DRAFT_544160, partial [Plenodomus tracheiphilus IPT5]